MVVKWDMCLDKVEASERSRTSACSPKGNMHVYEEEENFALLEENSCKF